MLVIANLSLSWLFYSNLFTELVVIAYNQNVNLKLLERYALYVISNTV